MEQVQQKQKSSKPAQPLRVVHGCDPPAAIPELLPIHMPQAHAMLSLVADPLASSLLAKSPLVLIGYNLTGYDIPLLHMKLRKYREHKTWGISDAIGRCYVLDMMHPVRSELA